MLSFSSSTCPCSSSPSYPFSRSFSSLPVPHPLECWCIGTIECHLKTDPNEHVVIPVRALRQHALHLRRNAIGQLQDYVGKRLIHGSTTMNNMWAGEGELVSETQLLHFYTISTPHTKQLCMSKEKIILALCRYTIFFEYQYALEKGNQH